MKGFPRLLITSLLLLLALSLNTGCASFAKKFKAFLNGRHSSNAKNGPKFSENGNMRFAGPDRQYRRMNRSQFEEDSEINARAGSLWVMEGQGAYLFAQNTVRMVGDLLNVTIDGAPQKQLNTKVRVIGKLLEKLDRPPSLRKPASKNKDGDKKDDAQDENKDALASAEGQGAQNPQSPLAAAEQEAAKPPTGNEAVLSVQTVPTRIVEQMRDGNYRVKGSETFMIGKREYKVIVTGIVRSEDFNDEGISAGRLLDPQFDIVSSKRGASTQ